MLHKNIEEIELENLNLIQNNCSVIIRDLENIKSILRARLAGRLADKDMAYYNRKIKSHISLIIITLNQSSVEAKRALKNAIKVEDE